MGEKEPGARRTARTESRLWNPSVVSRRTAEPKVWFLDGRGGVVEALAGGGGGAAPPSGGGGGACFAAGGGARGVPKEGAAAAAPGFLAASAGGHGLGGPCSPLLPCGAVSPSQVLERFPLFSRPTTTTAAPRLATPRRPTRAAASDGGADWADCFVGLPGAAAGTGSGSGSGCGAGAGAGPAAAFAGWPGGPSSLADTIVTATDDGGEAGASAGACAVSPEAEEEEEPWRRTPLRSMLRRELSLASAERRPRRELPSLSTVLPPPLRALLRLGPSRHAGACGPPGARRHDSSSVSAPSSPSPSSATCFGVKSTSCGDVPKARGRPRAGE